MRYLLSFMAVLLFLGCTPKYRVVNSYIPPQNETAPTCLNTCQIKLDACKKSCKAKFDTCKVKAEVAAKENYKKKMVIYQAKLEQYARDMEMVELERSLYYDDFYYSGLGYYGGGFYRPHSLFWASPMPLFVPHRPIRPTIEKEIQNAQMQMCEIDCGCTQSYDNCFISCGGEIKSKKVCIKNCPSDR